MKAPELQKTGVIVPSMAHYITLSCSVAIAIYELMSVVRFVVNQNSGIWQYKCLH